jgi:hypothetical protein
MKPVRQTLWASVFLATSSISANAECDPRTFLVQDIASIQRSGETELAFVLTSTEEEFDNAKRNASASGGYGLITGSANWSEAKEKARRIAESTKFDYRNSYAESYFSQTISPAAMNAYVTCLNAMRETPGLSLWLTERQGDFLTFKAFWVGRDTSLPNASYDEDPVIAGGTIVVKPNAWRKAVDENIVVKANGNDDILLSLKVGGEGASLVIVKEPPPVVWAREPVISDTKMSVVSTYSNPCYSGQQKTCIFTKHPGGTFVGGSAAITDRTTSDPSKYGEKFDYVNSTQVCGTITQSTNACELRQSAKGTLMALETYPVAAQ